MPQVGNAALDPLMLFEFQQVPVQLPIVAPLVPLSELASHKKEFLAGVRPLVGIKKTQIRAFLPSVARHFADERTLAVNDFIVRERKKEILVERVQDAECELIVMVLSEDRIVLHVRKRIVHPPHVPLHAESKPSSIPRQRHARPGGGLFRNGERSGKMHLDLPVHLAEKIDRLDIFASAVLIGDPLAFLPAVVEVKHRRDRVHSQTVHVVLIYPEQRVGDEEIPNFIPSIVENVRSPVGMLALTRIGVLVKRSPVETPKTESVLRKMSRHPVQNDADAVLVAEIHEVLEVVRSPIPGGRRIVPRDLVAPASGERMLADRKKLDVRKIHLLHVRHEPVGKFAVVQPLLRSGIGGLPASGMDFVDRDGPALPVKRHTFFHPFGILPRVLVQIDDSARIFGRTLAAERVGVALFESSLTLPNEEFVEHSGFCSGNEGFPDAVFLVFPHEIRTRVPCIEVANDAALVGIRRPDCEIDAGFSVNGAGMRSQFLVDLPVLSLSQKVEIVIRNQSFVCTLI